MAPPLKTTLRAFFMSEPSAIPSFTAHRVRIGENQWTRADGTEPLDAVSTMALVERAGSLAGKRILDLGCLEGGYCVAFAQLGAEEVVGVEARQSNLDCADFLKRRMALANVRFVKDDVKNLSVARYGAFDISFASGILYHLDDPYAFLMRIAELTRDFLVLDTHIAVEGNRGHHCSGLLTRRTFAANSYSGMEVPEYPPKASRLDIEQWRWSAFSNSTAFWLSELSLLDILREAGFARIIKIPTPGGYQCNEGCQRDCRILLIANK
jgi:SAM-dependent methyltransferase